MPTSATFCISVIILPYIFGWDINKGRGVSINAGDYLFTPPHPMHILPVANMSPKWPSRLSWTPRNHKEYLRKSRNLQCLWESNCITLHCIGSPNLRHMHYAAFYIASAFCYYYVMICYSNSLFWQEHFSVPCNDPDELLFHHFSLQTRGTFQKSGDFNQNELELLGWI